MTEPFRVLSLGWGIQSFCLATMSALGVLPKVDVAIHADTTWERSETYDFARRWTPWLEEHGMHVVTVTAYPATQRIVDDSGQTHAPLYTVSNDGLGDGQLKRSCTQRWKIAPIRRWLQANRDNRPVDQWIGITLDEVERAKPSDVRYVTLTWPFLWMKRPMRRGDVIRWLQEHDLEVPVKSGCIMCPYHDRATWRAIKNTSNGDWQKAVMVDEIIRHKRPNYVCYLTAERKPLVECDFSSQEDHGQLALWGEECSGACFL